MASEGSTGGWSARAAMNKSWLAFQDVLNGTFKVHTDDTVKAVTSVHVDDDDRPKTGEFNGLRYWGGLDPAGAKDLPALWGGSKPIPHGSPIPCPNCQTACSGFDDSALEYPPPPGVTLPPDLATRISYALKPCGCRVSQEWAGAYQVEAGRRKNGYPPKPVVDMTQAERDKVVAALEKRMNAIYVEAAKRPDGKMSVEQSFVANAIVDRLMRVCPGGHNKASTSAWQQEYLQHKPSVSAEMSSLTAEWVAALSRPSAAKPAPAYKTPGDLLEEFFGYGPDYPMPKPKAKEDAATVVPGPAQGPVPGAVVVTSGPVRGPVPGAQPTKDDVEAFHESLQRKRRRIRKIEE